MDEWSVDDLNKMINCKKFKAYGATPSRKKDLHMLWDLLWGRPEPTLPKRSKEKMDMDGGFNTEVDGDLCEGCEQHQFTSVLIRIFL